MMFLGPKFSAIFENLFYHLFYLCQRTPTLPIKETYFSERKQAYLPICILEYFFSPESGQ